MPRWAYAIPVLLAACAGCHTGSTGFLVPMCREVPAAAPVPRRTPAPAHEDFSRLRAFRNYYSLEHVGAFEHHFAVWFHCVEASVTYYAVAPDGTARVTGGSWGGLASNDGKPHAIPEAQRANADKVLAQHAGRYHHASGERVQYLGSYREVVVDEVVPLSGPGDPYARSVRHASATLRADADLTSLDGAASMMGGETFMCWRDLDVRPCGDPRWMDFAPAQGGGAVQLPALVSPGSPQPAAEQARFAEAVLAAARARAQDRPGTPLDELRVQEGARLLPPGLAPPLRASFTLYARSTDPHLPQADASIALEIPVADVFRAGAHVSGKTVIAGVELRADVDVHVTEPVEGSGEVRREVEIGYRLVDGRGNERTARARLKTKAIVDGDAVAMQELTWQDTATSSVHEPPLGQHFPGAGRFSSIDTYFGLSPRRDPFWPASLPRASR